MEENKNLDTAPELEETAVEEKTEKVKKPKKAKKEKPEKVKKEKPKKEKLLKNEALFKKGSYSVALTAIVLAGILVVNILVSALNDRFVLEFDMTAEKENSISEENIEYIKSVEQTVEVIVCSTEEEYTTYVGSMAEQSYGITYDTTASDYLKQTLTLINKYNAYNDNIEVKFVDTQSSEFTAITSEYGTNNLEYGSIIVSATREDGTKRYKKLSFDDIYVLTEDETYAYYGMTYATVDGNNIETALTGAISYVLSDIDVNVALLTGHSSTDITSSYKELLESNNYEVDVISDAVVANIDKKYDILVIASPSIDFMESEINAISQFLENDGNLGKGLMVYADASAPYLTDFYSFLNQWGVAIGEGILYETNSSYHATGDPTTLISANTGNIEDLSDLQLCITGYNVPMEPSFKTDGSKTAVSVVETMDTVTEAPKGVTEWAGADEAAKTAYSTVIETVKMEYDDDNKQIESYVTVFSSPYFLSSGYNESSSVANKDFSLAMVDRASGVGETDISFVSKSITNESFYDSVTESSANIIKILFMFILPIAVIALGVIIFVKRRNS